MVKQKEKVGEIAVRLGFITPEEVHKALRRQQEIEKTEGKRRLLGLVMVEQGLLSTTQLIEVLKELEHTAN